MPHALPRALALLLLETVLIFCLVAVAARMHLSGNGWTLSLAQHGVLKMLLIVFVTQVCLYVANLYSSQQVLNRRDLIVRIMQAVGAASFVLAGIYQWRPNLVVGRGVFLYVAVLVIIGVAGWRMLIDLTTKAMGRRQLDHKSR